MILEAYAATYPRAVMVHFEHTSLTQTAVMSPWWLNKVARFAVSKLDVRFEVTVPDDSALFIGICIVIL